MPKAVRKKWYDEKKGKILVPFTMERRFTNAQWEQICHGSTPQEMEDKWVIFEEDSVVYFVRSWTGEGIYKLHFKSTESGVAVESAFVRRQIGADCNAAEKVGALIDAFLLRADV